MRRLFQRICLIALLVCFLAPLEASANNCKTILGNAQEKFLLSAEMITMAEAFAAEHNLPFQILEVGPGQMGRKRLFIGIDHTNQALMEAFYKKFNRETAGTGDVAGTLPLFFQREADANHYLVGALRNGTEYDAMLYRSQQMYHRTVRGSIGTQNIGAFEYLIPMAGTQKENLQTFIDKPGERAPCKSTNCVAWIPQIELGKTAPGVPEGDRRFLFGELGISRSIEHRELSRRLMNGANENLSVVFVYLKGEAGIAEFKTNLKDALPPAPKVMYSKVIKGFIEVNEGAEKAIALIPDGGKVFIPIAAGASPEAVDALMRRAPDTAKGFDVHVLVNGISEKVFAEGIEKGQNLVRLHALFLGGNLRKLYSEGRVNYIPGNLADFAALVRAGHPNFKYDAIVVRVSPERNGEHSLGPNHDHIMTILEALPNIKVIAEVNPNIPFTNGTNRIPVGRITAKFEGKTTLAGPARVPLTEIEVTIGKQLAKLVPNNATVQVGIGNLFDGLPAALKTEGRQNLKVHTEMFGDALMEMVQNGVVTEAKTGFAYGSEDLYRWLDNNQKVLFERTEIVNNPAIVQNIEGFHAINTALQVNLYGEVNATMGPGGQRISSPGGQVEFMTGASRSTNGKAIIAIRSTAKAGELSTITLDLYPGPITTPHESVSHVVTEYGIAELRGYSTRDRAVNLINVAHPKFRKQLFDQAKERGLLRDADAPAINFIAEAA